jgi:hypothetical protein
MGYVSLLIDLQYIYSILGYGLSISTGYAFGQQSNITCVKAVVTTIQNVQVCNTDSQMWITYAVDQTSPVFPAALITCAQGKGFAWQKTCDWNVNWYVKPNQVLAGNSCNIPPGFLTTPGC